MKGGVTYADMERRKEALAFVGWMEKHKPTLFNHLWKLWKRFLAS